MCPRFDSWWHHETKHFNIRYSGVFIFYIACINHRRFSSFFVGFRCFGKPGCRPANRMNATVNVLCYKSKTLSNGENPLMICVSKSGKRTYKSLGISVNPLYWDFEKNKPKRNCPDKPFLCLQYISQAFSKKEETECRYLSMFIIFSRLSQFISVDTQRR